MTKFKYSPKRLKSNLKLGLFFIFIGVLLVAMSFGMEEWNDFPIQSIGVGHIGGGFFTLLLYGYENSNPYLTMESGVLIKNTLRRKKILLEELIEIKEFAGEIILKSQNSELVIDTQLMEPNSLKELKQTLASFPVMVSGNHDGVDTQTIP